MCIENRIRGLRGHQALRILEVLQAAGDAGRDVCLKKRADGWHVVSDSAEHGDVHVLGADLTDALGQYTNTVGIDLGFVGGTSQLDELGEEADETRVALEPVVEFCPFIVDEEEYGRAWVATQAAVDERAKRDTEPPSRIFCVYDGCDQEPTGLTSYCSGHWEQLRKESELRNAGAELVAVGDAE